MGLRAGVRPREAKRTGMLLKHRSPGIDSSSVQLRAGLEHLDRKAVTVLRWLNSNSVDFVVVGPVAHAIRGDVAAKGPAAIVPAPYGRNWDRLTRALVAEHAGLRSDRGLPGSERGDAVAVKLTADKLARGRRWMLRFGVYDLDIEGSGAHAAGARGQSSSPAEGTRSPRYQELLYEANRLEIAAGITVEVASPEDLEHFSHVRRTGTAPEFLVTRNAGAVDARPAVNAPPAADPSPAGAEASGAAPADTEPPAAGSEGSGTRPGGTPEA
jgi:hypothetical protein